MIYKVRHRTTYSYGEAVSFARCVLRLTPQSSPTQRVLESSIAVTPKPSQKVERIGPFDERALSIVLEEPHRELIIEARSRVEVQSRWNGEPADSPPWEVVPVRSFQNADLGIDGPASFLFPTSRTPIVPEITEYGRASFRPGRPIVEAASELMTRIRDDFTYDAGATTISTPPGEAFAARRGVCQDFANIMIGALRGLGLPAAYVSGYLRTIPPPGRRRLEGADATHAWVRLWAGDDHGWIGLDPTNAMLAQDDHIVLAVGRDYADVAPIDGVMLASGDQDLAVEVDVIPDDRPDVVQPLFGLQR